MTTPYAGNAANYPDDIGLPTDGEAPDAAELAIGVQGLADRTANIRNGNWVVGSGITAAVQSGGTIEVEGGGIIEIESAGRLYIRDNGVFEVQDGGFIELESGSSVTAFAGSVISVQGSLFVAVGADLDVEGDVTIIGDTGTLTTESLTVSTFGGEVNLNGGTVQRGLFSKTTTDARTALRPIVTLSDASQNISVDADVYFLPSAPAAPRTITLLGPTTSPGGNDAQEGEIIEIRRARGAGGNNYSIRDEDSGITIWTMTAGTGSIGSSVRCIMQANGRWEVLSWS